MSVSIDYFYTHISPWAYLGHQPFQDLAAKHGVEIRLRPVDLGGVFQATGGLPLGKRHQARQDLRFIEMQRWRDFRGVPLTLKPKHFPTSPKLADCCAVALAGDTQAAMRFTKSAFEAVWVNDLDVADPEVLARLLQELNLPEGDILAAAESEAVLKAYAENQELAVSLGVVGSPTYVLNGEPFWGQDRLELLDAALQSGREPYKPL